MSARIFERTCPKKHDGNMEMGQVSDAKCFGPSKVFLVRLTSSRQTWKIMHGRGICGEMVLIQSQPWHIWLVYSRRV